MPKATAIVRAPGLADLRRDLRRFSPEMAKAATSHLREVAVLVRDNARTKAPKRTGHLERNIRHSVRAKASSIYVDQNRVPYAGWLEYGGTIAPQGVPIVSKPLRFMNEAAEEAAPHIPEQLGDLLDRIADAQGFH